MIALLDTSEALDICAMELGCKVKQLVTPLTGFLRQKEHDEFAIDNGAFAGFRRDKFLSILARENEARHLCRFVVVPDMDECEFYLTVPEKGTFGNLDSLEEAKLKAFSVLTNNYPDYVLKGNYILNSLDKRATLA